MSLAISYQAPAKTLVAVNLFHLNFLYKETLKRGRNMRAAAAASVHASAGAEDDYGLTKWRAIIIKAI